MKTIDLTPTWAGVLRIYVEAAVNGSTVAGHHAGWKELIRMANIADAYVLYRKQIEREGA